MYDHQFEVDMKRISTYTIALAAILMLLLSGCNVTTGGTVRPRPQWDNYCWVSRPYGHHYSHHYTCGNRWSDWPYGRHHYGWH